MAAVLTRSPRKTSARPPGLLAAAALMLDYVLVVAVGISAGIGALVSAVPRAPTLHPAALPGDRWRFITIVNLRGVKESGVAFMAPTYLFIVTLAGCPRHRPVKTIAAGGHPEPVVAPPALPRSPAAATLWILMRSFASGCTAMTGVEAVSNGVTAFREPSVVSRPPHAHRDHHASWRCMLAGIAYLCHALRHRRHRAGPGRIREHPLAARRGRRRQGRILLHHDRLGAWWCWPCRRTPASPTSPGSAGSIAQDGYLPSAFAHRGRRLVYSHGILVLAGLSAGPC